jgi:DNA-binding Lrp family transcriptional regulator
MGVGENMLKDTDLKLISHLRNNGRKKITDISRDINTPVSTLYDRLGVLETQLRMRPTTLIDFQKLGYKSVVHIGFKVGYDDRKSFEEYLAAHPALNSFYRINHDFDFLAHLVFRDANKLKGFLENINSRFDIQAVKIFEVIDELTKEVFLSKSFE